MPLFKKHGILSLNDLFNLNCCKIYHQKKLGKLPEYHMGKLPSLHTINPHAHRRISDVYIFITVNNLQNCSINYKIGHAWNQLPNYLKCSNVSANVFSKNLKAYYLSKYTHFCSVINCFSCQLFACHFFIITLIPIHILILLLIIIALWEGRLTDICLNVLFPQVENYMCIWLNVMICTICTRN